MFVKKKKATSLILALVIALSLFSPASALDTRGFDEAQDESGKAVVSFEEQYAETPMAIALSEERAVYSDENYEEFSLSWISDGRRNLLQNATNGKIEVNYFYDENSLRTKKIVDGVTTTFSYGEINGVNGVLVSENRNGTIINYYYEPTDYPVARVCCPDGFTIDNVAYQLLYDDFSDHVIGIANENGEMIAQYEYEQGLVTTILEKDETGSWINVTGNPDSIGAINRIRYFGNYFDEETGWYYSDSYYDSVNDCFVSGKHNSDLNTLLAGISNVEGDVGLQRAVPSSVKSQVDELYNACISDSSFGRRISYSQNWYNVLDGLEVAARCIYGENNYDSDSGFDRKKERIAEGWVLFNRTEASGFGGSSLYNVTTYSGAFESITGSADRTSNARLPDTSSLAWDEAVYIACVLDVTSNSSYIEGLMAKPRGIDEQLYFVGLVYFQSAFRQGPNYLQWNFGTSAGYVDITDITVVGTAYNTNSAVVINNIGYPYTHNIFFSEV